jgi:tRNA modification GTPase
MYKEDTIAAVATPPGEGGVAIVRVSGPDAERVVSNIFCQKNKSDGRLKSHTLYHGTICDPRSNAVLDEVLVTVMRKPHSYTGETVAEVHCHGGVFLVHEILRLILSQGARHAEPGEFTKRAFLNGRIDLTQAEAVLDLIRARTQSGLSLAAKQAEGGVAEWVDGMRNSLLDCLVQVEAAIDFPEEEIELLQRDQLIAKISQFRNEIDRVIGTYEWGRLYREGARVCICGRPNVGKSSLLNALLGTDRVIVTAVPGTTRDVVEESINLGGLPVVLYDTAGLRETADCVERIGVELSRRYIMNADLIVVVMDGSSELAPDDETLLAKMDDKKMIIVVNKDDLPRKIDTKTLELFRNCGIFSASAKLGNGMEALKRGLRDTLLDVNREAPIVITNLRHKSALIRCENALDDAQVSLQENRSVEFVAVDLNEAKEALEEIVGRVDSEEILEHIFSEFCIGK